MGTKIIGIVYIVLGVLCLLGAIANPATLINAIPLLIVGIFALLSAIKSNKNYALIAFIAMVRFLVKIHLRSYV